MDESNINVAENTTTYLKEIDPELAMGFLAYDPIATLRLSSYFDGMITEPTGVYDNVPFMTETRSVSTLAEFVGWLVQHYDEKTKLLYMVQSYAEPQLYDFDKPPLKYNVRYAII